MVCAIGQTAGRRVDRRCEPNYTMGSAESLPGANAGPERRRQRWSLDINRLSRIRSTDQWQEFRRYQWPLAQGKTWDAPYEGADFDTSWSVSVQGWEDVTVPAGTFRAIRIDLKRTNSGGRRTVKQETLWYAPAVKRHVRLEEHEYVAGYHLKHTVEELVRFVAAE